MKHFLIILLKVYLFFLSVVIAFVLPPMCHIYWLGLITIPLWFTGYIYALTKEWIG